MPFSAPRRSTWVLVIGVIVCQFAVFEVSLRLKGGSEAAAEFQRLFTPDSAIGYRLKPGARSHFKTAEFETDIFINSAGVRDDELGPKTQDERRILILGDSLVLAVQVQVHETFCRRLEERLNRHYRASGVRYRVINGGVQGYGPVEEYLFFRDVVRTLDPDIVLVALYAANDAIEANTSAARLSVPSGAADPVVAGATTYAWIRRTVRRSMVLQIVRLRLVSLAERFGRAADVSPALRTYLPVAPTDVTEGLAVTRDCVDRIAALATERGAKTAVVLLPARFQVDDEDFGYLATRIASAGVTLDRNAATARFRTSLNGSAVPLLDALPALQAQKGPARLFFRQNAHFTPRGHEVIAEQIERFLVSSRLIPPQEDRP